MIQWHYKLDWAKFHLVIIIKRIHKNNLLRKKDEKDESVRKTVTWLQAEAECK